MTPTADPPALHALLIGIDAYPEPSADGVDVPALSGCVRDVERVRDFLAAAGVPSGRISCLTTAGDDDALRPTRQAMIAALLGLLDRAAPGEQAWIHFSGHGTRLKTAFGDDKQAGAVHDEALVPWDAPLSDAALIRDVEIAYLLKLFVEKDVFVTLVLDCCHSGGTALRGKDDVVRWAGELDGAERPLGDGLASYDELVDAWRWWWRPTRHWLPNWQTGDSGWLALPRGYALVAACGHDELAHEVETAEGERGGLLTDRLLQVLEGPAEITYRQLHERLQVAYGSRRRVQNPQVEGEIERTLFGGAARPATPSLRVLSRDGNRLRLDGGLAHGLRRGARVVVCPPAEDGVQTPEVRGVLTEVEAIESWAEIEPRGAVARSAVLAGARVRVDDPGHPSLALVVEIRSQDLGREARRALDAFAAVARDEVSPFVRAAGVGEAADVVATVADDHFVLLDADGAPLPMQPPLPAHPDEAWRLHQRLIHHARFRNVERLENGYDWSALAGKVDLELGLLPPGFEPGPEPPDPAPLPCGDDGVHRVQLGQWVCLTLRNRSRHDLHLALLNLRPDWSICQLLPQPGGGTVRVLEASPRADRPLRLPLRPGLPDGLDAGRDVLKLFAATRPTRFDWLSLPPLDERLRAAPTLPGSPLEELMARWGGEPRRDYGVHLPSGDEWTTVQVESWITRR